MNCTHCGASLTPEEWLRPSCRYCGKILAHYARNAEKVREVQMMMGAAPAIPPGMPGGPPMTGAPMGVVGGAIVPPGPVPPMFGGPMGAPGPAPGVVFANEVHRSVSWAIWLGVLVPVVIVLLVVLGVVAAIWLGR